MFETQLESACLLGLFKASTDIKASEKNLDNYQMYLTNKPSL